MLKVIHNYGGEKNLSFVFKANDPDRDWNNNIDILWESCEDIILTDEEKEDICKFCYDMLNVNDYFVDVLICEEEEDNKEE